MHFEYDDSNPEEQSEISITPNSEMLSIFKNLFSIQMDEEKDIDESTDFLNECLYKLREKPIGSF